MRDWKKPLREAEKNSIGLHDERTRRQFAEKVALPKPYINAMRWMTRRRRPPRTRSGLRVSAPRASAGTTTIGHGGDAPLEHLSSIEASEQWRSVARTGLPEVFNLRK